MTDLQDYVLSPDAWLRRALRASTGSSWQVRQDLCRGDWLCVVDDFDLHLLIPGLLVDRMNKGELTAWLTEHGVQDELTQQKTKRIADDIRARESAPELASGTRLRDLATEHGVFFFDYDTDATIRAMLLAKMRGGKYTRPCSICQGQLVRNSADTRDVCPECEPGEVDRMVSRNNGFNPTFTPFKAVAGDTVTIGEPTGTRMPGTLVAAKDTRPAQPVLTAHDIAKAAAVLDANHVPKLGDHYVFAMPSGASKVTVRFDGEQWTATDENGVTWHRPITRSANPTTTRPFLIQSLTRGQSPHAACSCYLCKLSESGEWAEFEAESRVDYGGECCRRMGSGLHGWLANARTKSDFRNFAIYFDGGGPVTVGSEKRRAGR